MNTNINVMETVDAPLPPMDKMEIPKPLPAAPKMAPPSVGPQGYGALTKPINDLTMLRDQYKDPAYKASLWYDMEFLAIKSNNWAKPPQNMQEYVVRENEWKKEQTMRNRLQTSNEISSRYNMIHDMYNAVEDDIAGYELAIEMLKQHS